MPYAKRPCYDADSHIMDRRHHMDGYGGAGTAGVAAVESAQDNRIISRRGPGMGSVRLVGDRAAIIESSGPAGTDDEHDPEGATIAFERQHLAALISQAREHLGQIDAAITRLNAGSYGRCDRCGQPIGPARLAARPVATRCIVCAAAR